MKNALRNERIKQYYRKNKNNENIYFNRIFFQACICVVLIVILSAVIKFGGDNVLVFKANLKNAISSSITKSQIESLKTFIQKNTEKIKNETLPDFNNKNSDETENEIENTLIENEEIYDEPPG